MTAKRTSATDSTTTDGTVTVVDNARLERYEIRVGSTLAGVADYRVEARAVVLPHTEIDSSMRGRGLAETLVQFALDDIRAKRQRVVPSCWYVARFIARHPDYADLVAD